MILDALHRIANHRQSLTREEARAVMAEVLTGECTDAQIAALLVALHMKGETVEEIVGFAEAIRAAATPLDIAEDSTLDVSGTGRDALVDTCGTGGDASGTFNISTATALVAAGAGVRVAKHGNRSVTSKCGSADVMEALGVNINLPPSALAACLRRSRHRLSFRARHAFRHEVRAARTARTSPAHRVQPSRPADQSRARLGDRSSASIPLDLVEKLAEALSMLGVHRALVVHGLDGLDEITITGPTRIAEVRDGAVRTYEVTPEEFGLKRATLAGHLWAETRPRMPPSFASFWRRKVSSSRRGLAERSRRPGGGGQRRSSRRSPAPGGTRYRFRRSLPKTARVSEIHERTSLISCRRRGP